MSEQVTELKRIPPDANSFTSGGRKIIVHNSLGIERYRHFQRLQVVAGFGADYQTLYQTLQKAYGLLNAVKVADAAVAINGALEGVNRRINGQTDPLLLICTLFMVPEGENLAHWDESRAAETINDWLEDGYDIRDFFQWAFRLVKQFASDLQSGSPLTSDGAPTSDNAS